MSEQQQQPLTLENVKGPYVVDNILYGDDANVAVWIQERIGGTLVELPFVAIGVIENDKIIAGAYFFNHQTTAGWSDLHICFAMDGIEITKGMVRRFLSYPFVQLKVRRLSADIELTNDRMIKLATLVGFKLEGTARRKGSDGADVGLFGLLPEECPFLKEEVPVR